MRTSDVLLLLFLAIGVAAVTGATFSILETRSFLTEAARAEGVVVAIERHTLYPPRGVESIDWSLRRWVSYPVVIEFADHNGLAHRITGSELLGYHVGDKVAVLYSPGDPEHALVDSALELWGGIVASMAVGLLFTAGCAFALIGPDRKRIDPLSLFQ